MRIVCESCSAEYNLDDSRVPAAGMDLKCPKCLHSFRVLPPGVEAPPSTPPPEAAGDWFVLRQSGNIYGPFDETAVEGMLLDAKLDGSESVSRDKTSWVPITSVQRFAAAAPGERTTETVAYRSPEAGARAGEDGAVDLPAPV